MNSSKLVRALPLASQYSLSKESRVYIVPDAERHYRIHRHMRSYCVCACSLTMHKRACHPLYARMCPSFRQLHWLDTCMQHTLTQPPARCYLIQIKPKIAVTHRLVLVHRVHSHSYRGASAAASLYAC